MISYHFQEKIKNALGKGKTRIRKSQKNPFKKKTELIKGLYKISQK